MGEFANLSKSLLALFFKYLKMEEIQKEYSRLMKKYSLPSLKELSNNFGVSISSENLIFYEIVDKILEKIFELAKQVEVITFINTSSSVSELYEAKMLDENEKWFEFYKDMMVFFWKGRKIQITGKEEEMAEFIKTANKKWKDEVRSKFAKFCDLFIKGWKEAAIREMDSNMNHYG